MRACLLRAAATVVGAVGGAGSAGEESLVSRELGRGGRERSTGSGSSGGASAVASGSGSGSGTGSGTGSDSASGSAEAGVSAAGRTAVSTALTRRQAAAWMSSLERRSEDPARISSRRTLASRQDATSGASGLRIASRTSRSWWRRAICASRFPGSEASSSRASVRRRGSVMRRRKPASVGRPAPRRFLSELGGLRVDPVPPPPSGVPDLGRPRVHPAAATRSLDVREGVRHATIGSTRSPKRLPDPLGMLRTVDTGDRIHTQPTQCRLGRPVRAGAGARPRWSGTRP